MGIDFVLLYELRPVHYVKCFCGESAEDFAQYMLCHAMTPDGEMRWRVLPGQRAVGPTFLQSLDMGFAAGLAT